MITMVMMTTIKKSAIYLCSIHRPHSLNSQTYPLSATSLLLFTLLAKPTTFSKVKDSLSRPAKEVSGKGLKGECNELHFKVHFKRLRA